MLEAKEKGNKGAGRVKVRGVDSFSAVVAGSSCHVGVIGEN